MNLAEALALAKEPSKFPAPLLDEAYAVIDERRRALLSAYEEAEARRPVRIIKIGRYPDVRNSDWWLRIDYSNGNTTKHNAPKAQIDALWEALAVDKAVLR